MDPLWLLRRITAPAASAGGSPATKSAGVARSPGEPVGAVQINNALALKEEGR